MKIIFAGRDDNEEDANEQKNNQEHIESFQ